MFRDKKWVDIIGSILCVACGQQQLVLPESEPGEGACGPGYPTSGVDDDGGDNRYAIQEGSIAPCLLFESVELDGETTYLSFAELYLQAKHDVSDYRSAIVVVGAQNCPACEALMVSLAEMADDFDAAGALMMTAIYCDNYDRTRCDFNLDVSVLIASSEGWPTERWYVTNDAESHLKPSFSASFPVVIVVRLEDMMVLRVLKTPNADELFRLIDTLH